MKKMKRFLVAMLGGLTAIACLAGISACKKDKEATVEEKPSYDININVPSVEVETCVHDYSVVYAEEKATCDVEGYKLMGCSKCGESITVSTGLGHDFGAASCTEPASCTICGKDKDLKLAAHTMVAAACEADAYCSECGYKEVGTALEHVIVDATCTADSYCSVCNKNFGGKHSLVDAFGTLVSNGTWKDKAVVNEETGIYYVAPVHTATESKEGYAAFKYCATCLGTYTDKATNLDWAVFMQKTRTDAEKAAYLFGSGLVYTEGYETIASEHNYVDFFNAEDLDDDGVAKKFQATCTENGLKNFQWCADCATSAKSELTTEEKIAKAVEVDEKAGRPAIFAVDYNAAVVAKLGHTSIDKDGNDSFVAGTPATCTTAGTQWSAKCQREVNGKKCNAEMNESKNVPVPAFGHNAGEQVANCDSDVKCINCEAVMITKRTHSWESAGVDNKAATCFESGYTNVQVCKYDNCDASTFTVVPMKSHKWATYTEAASADAVTCAKGFVRANIYYCTTCKADNVNTYAELVSDVYSITTWIYEVEPSTQHTKAAGFVDATCLKAAQNTKCTVCQADVFAAPANGHNYSVIPTCTTAGQCANANCDMTNGVVPAVNHKVDGKDAWVAYEATKPTCTTSGNLAYSQCSLCYVIKAADGKTEVQVGTDADGKAVYVAHSVEVGGSLYLAPVAHQFATVPEKLPTCEAVGNSEYKVCVNCGLKVDYVEYATVACGSDLASCYDYVACNHSYLVISYQGKQIVVAEEGYYAQQNGKWVLSETATSFKATWTGCGKDTYTTNRIPCIDHNEDGNCTVCDKFVGHTYDETTHLCECGKKED